MLSVSASFRLLGLQLMIRVVLLFPVESVCVNAKRRMRGSDRHTTEGFLQHTGELGVAIRDVCGFSIRQRIDDIAQR